MEIEILKVIVPKVRIKPEDSETALLIAKKMKLRYSLGILWWSCGMATFSGSYNYPFHDYPSVRSNSQFYPQKNTIIIPSIYAIRFNGEVFYKTSRIDAYQKEIIERILKEVGTWK